MRKIRCILLSVVLVSVFLVSCSAVEYQREIEVFIPDHPWESRLPEGLWYTLKWTVGDSVQTLHLGPEDRLVRISVPIGETVLVAAYPLGEMNPFGGALTPLDSSACLSLTQKDGVIVGELLDIDRIVTKRLNYGLLSSRIELRTDDFRLLEKVSFLRDLQNGELLDSSLKVCTLFGIESFALPNGVWVSEFIRDSSLVVTDGISGDLELPEGVFRYLNVEMDRELVLIVDSAGRCYSYLRQSLV